MADAALVIEVSGDGQGRHRLDRAKSLQGARRFTERDLFPSSYISGRTSFSDFAALSAAAPVPLAGAARLESLEPADRARLDRFIDETTDFGSMNAMVEDAVGAWTHNFVAGPDEPSGILLADTELGDRIRVMRELGVRQTAAGKAALAARDETAVFVAALDAFLHTTSDAVFEEIVTSLATSIATAGLSAPFSIVARRGGRLVAYIGSTTKTISKKAAKDLRAHLKKKGFFRRGETFLKALEKYFRSTALETLPNSARIVAFRSAANSLRTARMAGLVPNEAFEQLAMALRRKAGETVIDSQVVKGAAKTGFDFLSVSGQGRNAKLVINEVKNVTGKVPTRNFTTFGLGDVSRAKSTVGNAVEQARKAIKNAPNIDSTTKDALLDQLRRGRFEVRVIGNKAKGTSVNKDVRRQIATNLKKLMKLKRSPNVRFLEAK